MSCGELPEASQRSLNNVIEQRLTDQIKMLKSDGIFNIKQMMRSKGKGLSSVNVLLRIDASGLNGS